MLHREVRFTRCLSKGIEISRGVNIASLFVLTVPFL
jgi:hypothetical protein